MKILFLNAIPYYKRWPVSDEFTRFGANPPAITFPQLAACLPQRFEYEFIDGVVEKIKQKQFVNRLRGIDVVAISSHAGILSLNIELNIRIIKKINQKIRIILGGMHPTIFADEWLARGADFVVRREGEITFRELIEAIESNSDFSKIEGISFKKDGKVITNPDRCFISDLDTLPIPRWDLLNFNNYGLNNKRDGYTGTIETSRGCTLKCNFCLVSSVWNGTQRFKSTDRVVAELLVLKKIGVRKLGIVDNNFGQNYSRDMLLVESMIRKDIGMRWASFARADYILEHPDFYALAAKAGLENVLVGFEAMQKDNLNLLNKGYASQLGIEEYKKVFKTLKKNRIFTTGLFVIGYPGVSLQDLKYTMLHYNEICDFPLFAPFRPEKGTTGHDLVKGIIKEDLFYFDYHIRIGRADKIKGLLPIFTIFSWMRLTTKIFSKDRYSRQYILKLYKYIFTYFICHLNLKSLINFFYLFIIAPKGISYASYKKRIVERYIKKY